MTLKGILDASRQNALFSSLVVPSAIFCYASVATWRDGGSLTRWLQRLPHCCVRVSRYILYSLQLLFHLGKVAKSMSRDNARIVIMIMIVRARMRTYICFFFSFFFYIYIRTARAMADASKMSRSVWKSQRYMVRPHLCLHYFWKSNHRISLLSSL